MPADRIEAFRRLHSEGCFVMPNRWDVGTARALEQLGFPALATTSAGLAWTLGRPDAGVSLEQTLDHLRTIASAVTVPVNADFRTGYVTDPDGVYANVSAAVDTGIAGLSVEDSTDDPAEPLFDFELAVDRIRAARQAIDDSGTSVVLTGRSEGFVYGRPDIDETTRRLQAYGESGSRLSARAEDQRDRACQGRRRRRRGATGEPADQRPLHRRRRSRTARRTADQRGRHPGSGGLGRPARAQPRRSASTGPSPASRPCRTSRAGSTLTRRVTLRAPP